jgi:hypothetical protein
MGYEIEITPAMEDAGIDAFGDCDPVHGGLGAALLRVYRAMAAADPLYPHPPKALHDGR